MFTPTPSVQILPIHGGECCVVIDDFLRNPHAVVAHAVANRSQFAQAANSFYPGPELALHHDISHELQHYFDQHVRSALCA